MKAPLSRLVTNLALGGIILILLAQFWIFAAALELAHEPARRAPASLLMISGLGCVAVWALIAFLVRTGGKNQRG